MIAGMSIYQIAWFFLIYSFLGWVAEEVFHAVTLGQLVNRGFVHGPVCPIYGVGMLAILLLFHGVAAAKSPLALLQLFVGGGTLATLVELSAGWLLDTLFHARWWDYSDRQFHFHGYICLEFSLIWGLAIVLVLRIIHPMIRDYIVNRIPEAAGWPLLLGLYALFLADLMFTVAALCANGFPVQEISGQLRLRLLG